MKPQRAAPPELLILCLGSFQMMLEPLTPPHTWRNTLASHQASNSCAWLAQHHHLAGFTKYANLGPGSQSKGAEAVAATLRPEASGLGVSGVQPAATWTRKRVSLEPVKSLPPGRSRTASPFLEVFPAPPTPPPPAGDLLGELFRCTPPPLPPTGDFLGGLF